MSDRPLRILIDATAVPPDRRGVGTYVDSLLPNLESQGVSLMIVTRVSDLEHYRALCPRADLLAAPQHIDRRPVRLAWEQTGFAAMIAKTNASVVHSPHYTQPILTKKPVVVTLHDATFFTHPQLHQRAKRVFFSAWTKRSLRSAARCIVPSQATADELVRVAGASREQLEVIHLGVNGQTFHVPTEDEMMAVRNDLGLLDQPYIAFLGTLEPRKNVPGLIRGYVNAFAQHNAPPALVIAGGSGWDTDLDAAIAAVPEHLQVIRPGFLGANLLSGYLGGALAVAYPSFGEGFGLPVIEAMACGASVITTPLLSLSEVGGDVARYCDPDPESIASALRAVVSDPALRADLRTRGVARAGQFSWETAAQQHIEVYQEVARSAS